MNLQIDEPCSENWENMPVKEQGRFCDQCCKTVVDFTNMPSMDIIQFISERKNERVCGRFRSEQVLVPAAKVRSNITARVKQFFAALVLVFGGSLFSSCHQPQRMGKVKADNSKEWSETVFAPDTAKKQINKDTTDKEIMGRLEKPQQVQGGVRTLPPKCPEPAMGKVSTVKPK